MPRWLSKNSKNSMKNYKIAVIPGDGTGPEVIAEGLKVLEAIAQKCKFKIETVHYDFGGARYLKTKKKKKKKKIKKIPGNKKRSNDPSEGKPRNLGKTFFPAPAI